MTGGHSRRPRLLVIASTYPRWRDDHEPGFVHDLSRRLVSDFDVTVLCPRAPGALDTETLDGVEVVRHRYAPASLETLVNDGGIVTNLRLHRWKLLLVPGFLLMQWLAARRLLARGFDVVHAHWLVPQGLVATLAPRAGRVPLVTTSHGADLFALRGGIARALRRFVTRRSARLTVVSSAMREALVAEGVARERIEVIPMGVDFEGRFKAEAGVDREPGLLLFVGRLVEKKGLPHLIAAMPAILAARPGTRLVIVGHGPDAAALQAKVGALGLGHAVEFRGPLPQAELPALYRKASLFVAPFVAAVSGDQEGLPVALSEAIACGCPVVAGHVAGLEDIAGDEPHDGWLVDARDPVALADGVLASLADPVAAQGRADRLRLKLRGRLDWTVVAAGYARVLARAATGGN